MRELKDRIVLDEPCTRHAAHGELGSRSCVMTFPIVLVRVMFSTEVGAEVRDRVRDDRAANRHINADETLLEQRLREGLNVLVLLI